MPTVKEEINRYSEKYKLRRATHINRLAAETYKITNMDRRLKRKHPVGVLVCGKCPYELCEFVIVVLLYFVFYFLCKFV